MASGSCTGQRSYKNISIISGILLDSAILENYRLLELKRPLRSSGSTPLTQMKELSSRDAECLAQGHTAFPSLNEQKSDGHESLSIFLLQAMSSLLAEHPQAIPAT